MINSHRFNKSGRSDKKFGGKDFGKRDFGGRGSGNFSMHRAICDGCGEACEVPFKPTGNRPVFCNNCFKNNGNANSKKFGGGGLKERSFGKDFNTGNKNPEQFKEQFAILNAKLDKILKSLNPVVSNEASVENEGENLKPKKAAKKLKK